MKLINLQEIQNRDQLYLSLFVSLMITLALIVVRIYYSKEIEFAFLGWNLILAFIPFFLSSVVLFSSDKKIKTPLGIIILSVWLLFFPIAPIIINDFILLKQSDSIPIWFDFILLFSAALIGLLLAFISLFDIERKIKSDFKPVIANSFVVLSLILGSFGIYLGKQLNWNNIDLLGKPIELYSELYLIFCSPLENLEVFYLSFLCTALLIAGYLCFRTFANFHLRIINH